MKYDHLALSFPMEHSQILVSKLSYETIDKPYPSHSHGRGCFELHYVDCGTGHVEIDDQAYMLSAGSFYITGPFIPHAQFSDLQADKTSDRTPLHEYGVYLKLNDVQDTSEPDLLSALRNHPVWYASEQFQFQPLFTQIFTELDQQKVGYRENVISILRYLLVNVIRLLPQDENQMDSQCSSIEDQQHLMIDDLFLQQYATITLKSLAEQLCLSTRQTERILLQEYGRTFVQKREEARMSKALILLSDPALSITSIAELLGYSSTEHFSYSFKKYYQQSARDYRKHL